MTEELAGRVGQTWPPQQYAVEAGAVRRFVAAVGDANPRWVAEAPPTFATVIGFDQFMAQALDLAAFDTLLHGKTEMECFRPVRAGDQVTASTRIAGLRHRKGKTGSITFITFETSYTDQADQAVALCRQLVIGYQDAQP